jgi:dTDP-4-amino-4,6-dideoxygalactose transaminase
MKIPFNDPGRGVAKARDQIDAAVSRVLDSGWYVLGEEGKAFESEFAVAVGSGEAVGVASGTDAIELALRALDVGPGDEVVTQANTCVPTVAAIARAGATPVLCDVDRESATIDLDSLAGAIGKKTRAVVPVHLYGQIGDAEGVASLCEEREVAMVEDCAQAHGATQGERGAGTIGRAGAFSFYPTKNLAAVGDGGAIVTSDRELAERLRRVRVYGQTDRYRHETEGVNSRLDEIQAAILRVRLEGLEDDVSRRRKIATAYGEALSGGGVTPLRELPDRRHAYHLYVVRAPERDAFMEAMGDRGVGTLIHYPLPVHRQPAYRSLGVGPVDLSAADALAEEIVSLPLYPELSDEEVSHVCGALAACAG